MSGYEKGLSREHTRQSWFRKHSKSKEANTASRTTHPRQINTWQSFGSINGLHTTSGSNPQRTPSHRRVRTGHHSNKTSSTHGDEHNSEFQGFSECHKAFLHYIPRAHCLKTGVGGKCGNKPVLKDTFLCAGRVIFKLQTAVWGNPFVVFGSFRKDRRPQGSWLVSLT